jgi:uncharacterized RDD family membrane protein YckC
MRKVELVDKNVNYGGFGVRLMATVIDYIWLYGTMYIILWFLLGADLFNSEAPYTLIQFTFEYLIPFILVMILWNLTASSPGKMLFKMKIVDAETLQPVSAGRLLLRYVGYFFSIFSMGLGFLWVIWDKKRQGFHDKMAKTVVIRS